MLEKIKKAQVDDILDFSDDQVIDFFNNESLTVTNVKVYSSDDGEIVIVELDNEFYFTVHNLESDEKYFAYQIVGEGDSSDLEEEGYKFLNDDDEFRHKIVIREDGKAYTYYPSDIGTIYNIALERNDLDDNEPGEVSLCEFISSSASLNMILIIKEDEKAFILQGIEVEGRVKIQRSQT